ncbi:Tim44/TimA family putative adaptor protein [Marivivens sp. LCG002]|uniref:Tim44/TimA family putative adaptor protein n=1 Tax=Marivivens sp. LCG002 TaxID=3051171 RepID=UPI00255745EB|nr:Tim44/TimA family putative adaptor protein [Marivivens sp. LCG002]WIV50798.1 Tim44/TimA family putative adaptor protein [Marivivens sp. LCG002]
MNAPIIQLLVLAGIAIFLILRLRSVLGTREGFEKPNVVRDAAPKERRNFEVIEGGPDHDIIDHVPDGSSSARALAAMKRVDPDFNVSGFLQGARGAYEMILMGFEKGDLDSIRPFISDDVFDVFSSVVKQREEQGLVVKAEFIGISELAIHDAEFDEETKEGEVSVRFVGELSYVVENAEGQVVEGSQHAIKKQKDVWTFARDLSSEDPNWFLIATGE